MDILTDSLCSFIYQHSCSLFVMVISARGSQKFASVISSFLLPFAIYEADLAATWENQGTCITPNLTHLLLCCRSAYPGQLLSGDKRGKCFFIHMAQTPLLLPNPPGPQHDTLSSSRDRGYTMNKLCICIQMATDLISLLCKYKDWSKTSFYMLSTILLRLLEKVTSPSFIFILLIYFTGWFIIGLSTRPKRVLHHLGTESWGSLSWRSLFL